MKVNRVVLQLLFTVLVLLPSYCFSQNLKKDKKHNPEKILEFLDKNNDKLISKQEAKKAKKLNQNFAYLDSNNDGFLSLEELSGPNTSNRYTYLENDGIHLYFETEDKELYRKLLPTEFEIPTRLLAYTFTCDFYKMDSNSQPYKETSIFILGKYKNQEIWHCIYMPVTSKESMLVGKHRLGLPKTMGEIELVRSENEYQANSTDENNGKVALSINTSEYAFSDDEIKLLKELSVIPKLNLLNGEIIEMSGGRNISVFDLAKNYPNKVLLKAGEGQINLDSSVQTNYNPVSPLDLKPSKILIGYYMLNKIPFQLGKKLN